MTAKRYKIELNENGMFLYDSDVSMFMPISLEHIELLLNIQDTKIKELEE